MEGFVVRLCERRAALTLFVRVALLMVELSSPVFKLIDRKSNELEVENKHKKRFDSIA